MSCFSSIELFLFIILHLHSTARETDIKRSTTLFTKESTSRTKHPKPLTQNTPNKMARTRQTTTKPGLLSRLAGKKSTTTTTKQSHNPLTGKTKTTSTTHGGGTTTHGPHATHGTHATHGHTHTHGTRGTTANPVTGTHHTQRRKVTMGDKLSGAMMKLNGTITRRPGKKVRF